MVKKINVEEPFDLKVGERVLWKGIELSVIEVTPIHVVAWNQTLRITTDRPGVLTKVVVDGN
jgi:hypothetical protein